MTDLEIEDREFLRELRETAHATGKRLYLFGQSYLVIWSLYGEAKKSPRGVQEGGAGKVPKRTTAARAGK